MKKWKKLKKRKQSFAATMIKRKATSGRTWELSFELHAGNDMSLFVRGTKPTNIVFFFLKIRKKKKRVGQDIC